MFSLDTLLVLIPALPLAATLVTAAFGKLMLRQQSHLPALLCVGGSFLLSLVLLLAVRGGVHELAEAAEVGEAVAAGDASEAQVGYHHEVTLWTWAAVDDALSSGSGAIDDGLGRAFQIDVTLRADPLTAIMLVTVTFVSTLVVLYSIGYMHGDPGYWRFFTYVSLFVFSMTMLVSVSNFALLYVFWEAVGVCSYLLIGFWFERPSAAAAGKKAFLVNRIGDFGFALGVFLIWTTYGTLNFHDVATDGGAVVHGVLGNARLAGDAASTVGFVGGGVGMAIALLLFVGACGKSAQFPLHVWLPDAMEGPTPVSALIHAATMVTAGVYLVVRCTPLFLVSPEAQAVVASIGGVTALMAGFIALTQHDLKRVLAYSTVSQLGYMFLGLGTGTLAGITAGMFHLFTHAFFKALLFLGAGSVMHAMGNCIDMRRFGGLRHVMPRTHLTFWFGCLALAGVVPFAGFWSKDAIMAAVHDVAEHGDAGWQQPLYHVLFLVGLFTALLTAFYTFRALFLTFYGAERIPAEAGSHAHESPATMTVPLVVLAACSLVVGAYFELTHGFAHFLAETPSLAFEAIRATTAPGEFHLNVAAVSTLVALAGMGLAAFLYLGGRREIDFAARRVEGLERLKERNPLANAALVGLVLAPLRAVYSLSLGKLFFDALYGAIVIAPLTALARLSYLADRVVIDGLVNLCGRLPLAVGHVLRALQSGMVQFYALAMVLGLLVIMGTLMFVWPA